MGKRTISQGDYNLSYEELFISHLNRKLGFKPVPAAGIFEYADLLIIKERTEQARRAREEKVRPVKTERRETLSNTTRYRQVAGESTIYGGRK